MNYERLGFFIQRQKSDDQLLDTFVLSNRELVLERIDGYTVQPDREAEIELRIPRKQWIQDEVEILSARLRNHMETVSHGTMKTNHPLRRI